MKCDPTRTLRALPVLLACLGLAGCPSPVHNTSDGGGSRGTSFVFTTTTPFVFRTTTASTTVVNCAKSLDNCYLHSQMQAYADVTIKLVVRFYDSVYAHMAHPAGYVFIAQGTRAAAGAGCGIATDASYFYCSIDQKIYLGQEAEWLFYNRFGSVGPAVALAHEMGHHAQQQVGIPSPAVGDNAASIQHENQADCMAGAWVAWASAPGQNYIEYPKDLQNITGLMTAIASVEGPDRDHGTDVERERSFALGYGGGIRACNAY